MNTESLKPDTCWREVTWVGRWTRSDDAVKLTRSDDVKLTRSDDVKLAGNDDAKLTRSDDAVW